MSTSARRRLMRDFRRLQSDPPTGISAAPMDDNILKWAGVIFGPDSSIWEGGTFNLVLEFSEEYPNKPPKVRFVTKIFHPNVYADGSICLDILQNQWSPIYDIAAILTSIQSLLCDPNPNSPANSEAASLFQSNKREYNRRVRDIVEQSWVDAGEGEEDDDDDDDDEDDSEDDDDDEDDEEDEEEEEEGKDKTAGAPSSAPAANSQVESSADSSAMDTA
mmetsp:Transcript_20282/g.39760  ORF Transcript_20282/g.39760 Transcript_20282/m.39760 type:complete len:219 (+) Transcript_20282:670-1326(+)